MNIPWKLKSAAFGLLDRFPPRVLHLLQKHITRRSHRPIGPSADWDFFAERIHRHGARRLVEFGAGKDLAQNLFLARHIAHQAVVDIDPMLNLGLLNRALRELHARGLASDPTPVANLDALAQRFGIVYRAPMDMAATSFADAAFDICVTENTLEHIPVAAIRAIYRELARVLVPGGIVCFRIGYSDHYWHTDPRIGALNFLRYPESVWARHNHRNHYQNRLRHADHRGLLVEAGFAILEDLPGSRYEAWRDRVGTMELLRTEEDLALNGRFVAANGTGVRRTG